MAKKKHRKTAFVPRMIVPAALAATIPAIAVGACSGTVTTGSAGSDATSTATSSGFTVAAVAYPAYEAGTSTSAASSTAASSTAASSSSTSGFTVAAVAYPAYEAGADAG
jgi:hypothetical protein